MSWVPPATPAQTAKPANKAMNTPVVDFVRRYAQQHTTRMHMPGHKGRGPLGCEELDITEIAGADELYEAEGIIAQSEANATQLFGTARTYYSTEGSRHPIQLGADLCCDSAHKTLPVLTGGAYLHLGPSVQADEAAVRNALALFGSTSPSYLILQSLDAANAVLADSFREKLDVCRWRLGMLCRELDAIRPGLALPLTGAHREPLKLTLDAAALGLSGQQLAQALRERGVECEYADPRYVVLMPSAESSAAEFACLQTALHAICDEAPAADVSVTTDNPAAFAALDRKSVV